MFGFVFVGAGSPRRIFGGNEIRYLNNKLVDLVGFWINVKRKGKKVVHTKSIGTERNGEEVEKRLDLHLVVSKMRLTATQLYSQSIHQPTIHSFIRSFVHSHKHTLLFGNVHSFKLTT